MLSMRQSHLFSLPLLALLAGQAAGACAPLRYGYTDKAVAPYYLGSGAEEGKPPGALAELTRESVNGGGCPIVMVRMPPARLRASLEEGRIDATSLFAPDIIGTVPNTVYPRDKSGKIDPSRGIPLYTVVFVRAGDRYPRHGEPAALLRGRTVGLSQGAPHIAAVRGLGVEVDDGAANPELNFEKLKLGRIDAFAISISSMDDMDPMMAARYGRQFVRLDKPLLTSSSYLALNQAYYAANRGQAEAIWRWYGKHGQARMTALLKKYRD
jgi:ABC-type amino acid transport substrate-binding protein